MTLVESVFKKSKGDRGRMSFEEIARNVRVGIDEVEHVVMKALALGLVKGSIDEVDKVVLVRFLLTPSGPC